MGLYGKQMPVASHKQVSVPIKVNASKLMGIVKAASQGYFPEGPSTHGVKGRNAVHPPLNGGDGVVPTAGIGEDYAALPSQHGHAENAVYIVFP